MKKKDKKISFQNLGQSIFIPNRKDITEINIERKRQKNLKKNIMKK